MSGRVCSLRRTLILGTLLAAAGLGHQGWGALAATSTPAFGPNHQVTAQSPGGWDEPSGIAGSDGQLYVASQNPNTSGTPDTTLSLSSDGLTWHEDTAYYDYLAARAEGQTGDVTMAADRAGTVFLGHLTAALQTDIDYTRDGGKTWQTANDVAAAPSPGAASSSPFLVDRPWIAAYSPDTNYKDTSVYLEYHDFAASLVYIVTCSMASGTLQCAAPIPVSNSQTACNSIPGGVAVSPAGSAHPGRVFAVWTTADPQTNAASGCNYTQMAPFYALYVAWSDTPSDPSSWHQVPVYIGPNGSGENCPGTAPVEGVSTNTCADMSELFTPVAVDATGNAYVGFVDYIDTLDKHYDVYLERSTDGGNTWDGSTSGAGRPVLVSNAGGTHYTPNIVAGAAGHVALSYFDTSYATKPFMSGDACPTGVPPQTSCQGKNQPEPASAAWVFDVATSSDAASAQPTFTQTQVSDAGAVVHYGDMCNLGIYCDGSSSGNRSMFENTTLFPNRGGDLVAAWTDQRLDPTAAQDAGQSDAQSRQVAHDEIFAATQVTPAAPKPTKAPTPPPSKHKKPTHKAAPSCARPSGRLAGTKLGPLALDMSRARARHVLGRFSTHGRPHMDFFCLKPGGIRVGYAYPRLLRTQPKRVRSQLNGRAVLLLTSSRFYSLRGIRQGTRLPRARHSLRLNGPFHIGVNDWYLASNGSTRAVLKVHRGIVAEIGVADKRLTSSHAADVRFLTGFA